MWCPHVSRSWIGYSMHHSGRSRMMSYWLLHVPPPWHLFAMKSRRLAPTHFWGRLRVPTFREVFFPGSYGGFYKWGYPNSWMVYKGKSYYKWMMTWGTPVLETYGMQASQACELLLPSWRPLAELLFGATTWRDPFLLLSKPGWFIWGVTPGFPQIVSSNTTLCPHTV